VLVQTGNNRIDYSHYQPIKLKYNKFKINKKDAQYLVFCERFLVRVIYTRFVGNYFYDKLSFFEYIAAVRHYYGKLATGTYFDLLFMPSQWAVFHR